MAFVYPVVAIAAGVLRPNCLRRAPNVQRESCLSDEDEFLSTCLSARQIHYSSKHTHRIYNICVSSAYL